jgi:hypothetical protein
MKTRFPMPARIMSFGMVLSFGLAAACTGELETENAEDGIPTEITTDTMGEVDPTPAAAAGLQDVPEAEGSIGEDSAPGSMDQRVMPESEVGSGAEPGQPIVEGEDVPPNRAVNTNTNPGA